MSKFKCEKIQVYKMSKKKDVVKGDWTRGDGNQESRPVKQST